MTTTDVNRYVLLSCAAAAMLAGCGISQSAIDVQASSAIAADGLPRATELRGDSEARYAVLYSFRDERDGSRPIAAVTPLGGRLYGTTVSGGYTVGTVYVVTTAGAEKVLHRFAGPPKDGEDPEGSLLAVDGSLYGTAYTGGIGKGGGGAVFAITPAGTEHLVYSFKRRGDVNSPQGALTLLNRKMYGTASGSDGRQGYGGIFELTPNGKERVVYRFKGPPNDGIFPASNLIAVNGTLYGVAPGGSDDEGIIFSVTPSGTEHVLYNFKGGPKDGGDPQGFAFLNGSFYGTTSRGGTDTSCDEGCGTVFAFTTAGKERVLHNFALSDGTKPGASLVAYNGYLYGTTCAGGGYGNGYDCPDRTGYYYGAGTVFRISTSGAFEVTHAFGGDPDGGNPVAPLVALNGVLYGTTQTGGSVGPGTVFRISPKVSH